MYLTETNFLRCWTADDLSGGYKHSSLRCKRACVEHSRKFLRVSTHRRVFPRPLSAGNALRFLVPFLRRDEVAILVPTARHWQVLQSIVAGLSHPAGNLFHDIETAVLMREHGVREIITADTDFLQFQFLKVTNPVLRVA